TCGWHTPPSTPEVRERIRKLGRREYGTIFAKLHAVQEGKDYAYVCYAPSEYDAIYWTWWSIKHELQGGRHLTRGELDYIYNLASTRVDTLRHIVAGVRNAEQCGDFFLTVSRCFIRYNRPWYRHPRWHFWHWRFQVHPWQQARRWLFSR